MKPHEYESVQPSRADALWAWGYAVVGSALWVGGIIFWCRGGIW